jgi:hypothetical protein
MDTEKLSVKTFGITSEDIQHNLSGYVDKITKKSWEKLEKRFASKEDYVKILYYFRFRKKLPCKEIVQQLRISSPSRISITYEDLGWSWRYEGGFDEVVKQYNEEKNEICELVGHFNFESLEETVKEEFNRYYETVKDIKIGKYYKKLGFQNKIDYLQTLYYFVKVKNLTSQEIANYFNCNLRSMQRYLKEINLNLDKQTANLLIAIKQKRNYKQSFKNARLTAIKWLIENGLFGTIEENLARTYLNENLPKYLDTNKYEVVVGLNTNSIIAPKQIDIPIIIISKSKGIYHKFAIEFNGDNYHKDNKRENDKVNILSKNGWTYLSVLYNTRGSKLQNEVYGKIEDQLDVCCENIRNIVTGGRYENVL